MRRMKAKSKFLCFLIILCLILCSLTSCLMSNTSEIDSEDVKNYIAEEIGVDISDSELAEVYDTHDNFLGDGLLYVEARLYGEIINQIKSDSRWRNLPLSQTFEQLTGTHLTDDNGESLFKTVENGYYFLCDKQQEGNEQDDSEIFNRYSCNFCLAVYDIDKNILYFYRYDT